MSSEGFRIEVVSGDGSGAPTLVVSGELDMASAPSLLGTVETIRPLRHRLILDTAAVSFIDSFGLRTLLAVREARGQRVRIEFGDVQLLAGRHPTVLGDPRQQ